MPLLPSEVYDYYLMVKDDLEYGQDRPTRASVQLSDVVKLVVDEPGSAGNNWTVEVTEPAGTSALDVSASDQDVTIALSVSSGTGVDADNTGALIAAAWNSAISGVTAHPIGDGSAYLDDPVSQTSFSDGTDADLSVSGAAANYLRAQDSATLLELMQDSLSSGDLTSVSGGDTSTVVDGASTFVPGAHVGDYVEFDASTSTASLQGLTRPIVANTDRTLTLGGDALPASVGSGETYRVVSQVAQRAIDSLREGKSLGDSPAGSVYGEELQVLDALARMTEQLSQVQATATLTASGNATDSKTVTIAGKTYTFEATLSDSDGNVHIGGSASDTLDNLIAAITLGSGSGSDYAASTTLHPSVTAAAGAGDTMVVTDRKHGGAGGNNLEVSTDDSNLAWDDANLTGGTTTALSDRQTTSGTTGTGSTKSEVVSSRTDMRVDEFKGQTLTISGESRRVVGNREDTFVLAYDLSSAPSSGTSYTVKVPTLGGHRYTGRMHAVHPGGHPDGRFLAQLLSEALSAVESFTLPS